MTRAEAMNQKIIRLNKDRKFVYCGMCQYCKHSKKFKYALPGDSNVCTNEKSKWYEAFHMDFINEKYIDGCEFFEVVSDQDLLKQIASKGIDLQLMEKKKKLKNWFDTLEKTLG